MAGASPIKGRPNWFLRFVMRLPLWLFRLRLAWLLGRRFIVLRHTGRLSGRERQAFIEVTLREKGVIYVTSGWGERSQWFQNVTANPRVTISVGGRTVAATAERVSVEEAERVLSEYKRRYRIAAWFLGPMFGSRDPAELAQALPVVAFRRERE